MSEQTPELTDLHKRIPPKPLTRRFIKKELKQTKEAALIDPLTGLLNEKGFERKVIEEISRARREGHKIALLFLDLNGLKVINDELGHTVGDEFIKAGADILTSSFRPTDIISRKGEKSDEFLIAVPITQMDQVKDFYSRVETNTNGANQNWEGYPIIIPAGAVELDFNDIPGSIARADHGMYIAKEKSRDIRKNVLHMESSMTAA